jgi:hypothetical protein
MTNYDPVSHYNIAMSGHWDSWVPANGGKEPISEIEGKRYQYCYNPKQKRHAYYCLTDDLILDHEMREYLPSCLR